MPSIFLYNSDTIMGLLIKTFDKLEYAERFLYLGEMKFSHVKHFQSIEDNCIRGDVQEGICSETFVIDLPSVDKITIQGKSGGKTFICDWKKAREAYGLPEKGSMEFKLKYVADTLIFCMTVVEKGMDNIGKVLNNCKSFGKYSVIIPDPNSFLESCKNRLEIESYGKVSYNDTDEKGIYVKSKCYELQSEFRICINANQQKTKIVRIGRINGLIVEADKL